MLTRGQGRARVRAKARAGQGGQGGQPRSGLGHRPRRQRPGPGDEPEGAARRTRRSPGQDTGQGQTRSQVILGAAERGFANRGYTKVYREYHTVAEEALNKDEIPGGYRFYVRRYFQLIRPRD